ncbi:MAG: DUF503 domain-containing protein [Firmicutes bacterium]|nr:DUF503 domain-containing protein [Bacillota bacterium]
MSSSIAWATLLIRTEGCASIKDKRSVITGLTEGLGRLKGVAISETGHRDSHKVAELTVAVVGDSPSYVEGRIKDIIGYIEARDVTEVIVMRLEIG